jgi:glycerol-3-phosphate acyltransferase PlsY
MLEVILWSLFGFFLGSVPFALVIGKLFTKTDIRSIGDGNPGGTNALKAGGLKAGIPAILLDIAKGFLPIFLAQAYGLSKWELIPVCLAPILGHAFSPFLKFRGGKALGATGGVWVALIGLWAFPVYGALAVPFTIFQTEHAWSANAGMLALIGYAILFGEPWMVAFAALNTLVIAWTHRLDLAHPMQLRRWVTRRFLGRRV